MFNKITRLPTLPNSLRFLYCAYNNIDSITFLPNNITGIDCEFNSIKWLGNRLPDSLKSLGCDNNLLKSLPSLPKGLLTLVCNYNLLNELPELPDTMAMLDCRVNPNLSCLPKLTNIYTLIFDSTAVACLPNYGNVTNSIPVLNSVPLCDSGNANGCAVYTNINEIPIGIVNVFPNPATTTCTLKTDAPNQMCCAIVFDAVGRQVMPLFNNQHLSTFDFNCTSLSTGLYFVTVKNEQGKVGVLKLVKQ